MTPTMIQQPAIRLVRTDAGPEPDDIIKRVYAAEYSTNKHGAKSRTARLCNCTPPHVTNVLRRHGIEEVKPKVPGFKVPEFDKIPPYERLPDFYPEPIKPVLCQVEPLIVETDIKQAESFETAETVAVPQIEPLQPTPFQTVDACVIDRGVPPVSNNYRRDESEFVLCLVLSITMVVTACVLLVATKHAGLALALTLPMLAMWCVVGGAARDARYWSQGTYGDDECYN